MKAEKEFPQFNRPESHGSFLGHEMSETVDARYVLLRVSTESGFLAPSLHGTQLELSNSAAHRQVASIADGRKWLTSEFRRMFPTHECNAHCSRHGPSMAEVFSTPGGPAN